MSKREDFIRRDMANLAAYNQRRIAKWRRNFNRYCNNGWRAEDVRELYGNPLSYWQGAIEEDLGPAPNLNVIRSVIDTHVSKLSELKVRPFFNPLVGTFHTRKVCRNAQVYFDEFYQDQDVYRKAVESMRHADIFEVGYLWVDDDERKITRLAPWEWMFDPAEWWYGKVTRCMLLQKQYPLRALKDHLKLPAADDLKKHLEDDPACKVERVIYWDLLEKKKTYIIADRICDEKRIEYECMPVAMIYSEEPLKGSISVSKADTLYTIQRQIDMLCERIHIAASLSPANTIWVPENSSVKPSMISNQIGAIYEYRPVPGTSGSGVTVATPPAIDNQYLQFLEFWTRQAYEIEGISQLSAQAKKPSGLNSGVALQTVEDVESERHNPVLQSFIHLLMEVARIAIEVFPQGDDLLPKKRTRARVKWGEIKREHEAFSMQFSASSSLSKDPKVKMEQIEKLIKMQVINPALAASLLEFPDLEGAYSITSASYDYCQRIIERAVEDDIYEFYPVVSLQQLFGEAVNTLLRLDANEEKPEILARLVKLITIVKGKMDAVNAVLTPPAPPPAAPPAPAPEAAAPPVVAPPPVPAEAAVPAGAPVPIPAPVA